MYEWVSECVCVCVCVCVNAIRWKIWVHKSPSLADWIYVGIVCRPDLFGLAMPCMATQSTWGNQRLSIHVSMYVCFYRLPVRVSITSRSLCCYCTCCSIFSVGVSLLGPCTRSFEGPRAFCVVVIAYVIQFVLCPIYKCFGGWLVSRSLNSRRNKQGLARYLVCVSFQSFNNFVPINMYLVFIIVFCSLFCFVLVWGGAGFQCFVITSVVARGTDITTVHPDRFVPGTLIANSNFCFVLYPFHLGLQVVVFKSLWFDMHYQNLCNCLFRREHRKPLRTDEATMQFFVRQRVSTIMAKCRGW